MNDCMTGLSNTKILTVWQCRFDNACLENAPLLLLGKRSPPRYGGWFPAQ